jgi:uncharacterized protein (DUF58 family)
MLDAFIIFLLFIFFLAALAGDSFIFSILYLFTGAYVLGRIWSKRSLANLQIQRRYPSHAFIGESLSAELSIHNRGWLPLVWVQFQEALPLEISLAGSIRKVYTLGPKDSFTLSYHLEPRKRGYYPVGPFQARTADILGLGPDDMRQIPSDYITVFPQVIPLKGVALPSRSPLGAIKHSLPIFEDPARPMGKRGYQVGDSLRRVDWKTTAAVGKLQVKKFEPSVDLQVEILLNLNEDEFESRYKLEVTELAIIVAASIANWCSQHKIITGLQINGETSREPGTRLTRILPNKGRGHLVKILEQLAYAQKTTSPTITEKLRESTSFLGWGTTLVLIAGKGDDQLLDELYRLRQKGVQVVLIFCGSVSNLKNIRSRAKFFGVRVYSVERVSELETWS